MHLSRSNINPTFKISQGSSEQLTTNERNESRISRLWDFNVGVIGGSGLYQMDALQEVQAHDIDTPFGKPSDQVMTGTVLVRLAVILA